MVNVLLYSCRGCFSGIIAKEPKNHPNWEQPLAEALAGLGVYGYEFPTSAENFTAMTLDVEVDGQTQSLRMGLFESSFPVCSRILVSVHLLLS